MRHYLLFLLLLTGCAWAQDKAQLARLNSSPLTAAAFMRYVEVKADPGWWSYLLANPRKTSQFVELGRSCLQAAHNLGWGDAESADSQAGGDASAPAVLQMLDGWKGKLSVQVALPPGNWTQAQRDEMMDNLSLLCSPLGNPYACRPRGGQLQVEVSFSPKVTKVGGQVSSDGNRYSFVFPTSGQATTMPIEDLLKKGMK